MITRRAKCTGLILWLATVLAIFIVGRCWGNELTFFIWSDTHFGAYDYSYTTRLEIMEDMNQLVGQDFPAILGGQVGRPSFLLHTGDVTEHGYASEWSAPHLADQRSYISTIGHLNVTNRTYEIMGNHDVNDATQAVRSQLVARHGSTYYSTDIKGVHFVMLDPYTGGNAQKAYPDLDQDQLNWLTQDLGSIPTNTPVVVSLHINPDPTVGARYSHLQDSSQPLANILTQYNTVLMLVGHNHLAEHRSWYNIDVISSGYNYWPGGSLPGMESQFLAVRFTEDTLSLVAYDWDANTWGPTGGWGAYLNKAITGLVIPEYLADFDNDGDVDIFDVNSFAAAYNENNPTADFQNDGDVDIFDVGSFAATYNEEKAGAGAASVAEPGTMILMGAVLAVVLRRAGFRAR